MLKLLISFSDQGPVYPKPARNKIHGTEHSDTEFSKSICLLNI